jgi:hypothetical protein
MTIPFTQYIPPHGDQRKREIDRPETIELLAAAVIVLGGRFECEVLSTGDVSLTVSALVDGVDQQVASVLVPNGADVPPAIDRLVIEAHGFL